jgi:dinuclear metal center YbgI/SA1388 family protein
MKQKSASRESIETYLNELLQISHFKDYCPNGLQVQGKKNIQKIISGVTASLALIDRAIEEKADAILVHHGWFWKNDDERIIGQLHTRLKRLMDHEINLFAYHLPLDQHPKFGNNVQLAKVLGFSIDGQSSSTPLVWFGGLENATKKLISLEKLSASIEKKLERAPLVIGEPNTLIKKVAWCTGGAQGYIEEAAKLGVDVYISGEISEQTTHAARELGIAYISAGHHATERYGVQALGKHLAQEFGIQHQFVDVPNPV